MNDRERFVSIVRGETPDYTPIFGFPGAPGMSLGCMRPTRSRLAAGGMPAYVGGCDANGLPFRKTEVQSWCRYWGTTGPVVLDFSVASGEAGFKETRRIEGGFEIIESESGALTRQVVDNDITYSMPEFIRYPVRDRASWDLYKQRMTPTRVMTPEEIEANCRRFDARTRPLCIGVGSTYGLVRGLMGTEAASYAFYDDPELVHDIIEWRLAQIRRAVFPLIERLKPEIVATGEDLCYNHGMLLSPAHFEAFCAPYYREVCGLAQSCNVPLRAIDTDGNAMEFTPIAAACGFNAIYPYEVKAGNDLFELRRLLPQFVLFGWLEKEVINEGNEALIEPEIRSKVPPLLATGRYFPNGDHGIQPPATFPNLCKFMALLHEICNNPCGEFPRA